MASEFVSALGGSVAVESIAYYDASNTLQSLVYVDGELAGDDFALRPDTGGISADD